MVQRAGNALANKLNGKLSPLLQSPPLLQKNTHQKRNNVERQLDSQQPYTITEETRNG